MRRILLLSSSLLLTVGCGGDTPTGSSFPTLAITTNSLPEGIRSVSYTTSLAATGGNSGYGWSVAAGSLPAGLALTGSSGAIAGTPTDQGSSAFTIRVTSADGQAATRELTLTVAPPPTLQPGDLCGVNPAYAIATFEDANLEGRVRAAAGVTGDLTCEVVTSFTRLEAFAAGITGLAGIQNASSVDTLFLNLNAITDVSPLSAMTSLRWVALYGNSLTSVNPLGGLSELEVLWVYDNSIETVSALGGLTGLRELVAMNNSITDLSGLAGLTHLQRLFVSNNALTHMRPVAGLTGLVDLVLHDNSITTIESLGALSGLARLELQDNLLTDVSGLMGANALTKLDLRNNAITDITPLSGLTNLTDLLLSGNPGLTSIQPLLDNSGLGDGDLVILGSIPNVSCADVALLEATGASVTSSGCVG